MKYKVGDKVKVVQFTETTIDAPEYTVGNPGRERSPDWQIAGAVYPLSVHSVRSDRLQSCPDSPPPY